MHILGKKRVLFSPQFFPFLKMHFMAMFNARERMSPKDRAKYDAWSEQANHADMIMAPAIIFIIILVIALAIFYQHYQNEEARRAAARTATFATGNGDDIERGAVLNDGNDKQWYNSTAGIPAKQQPEVHKTVGRKSPRK